MKQVVLVTGASSGIGEATAKMLYEAGYDVYATARQLDRIAKLQELGIKTIALDVTDEASIKRAVGKIGRIDVLINNAGYGEYGAFEEVSLEEARQQLEVNVFGMARLTQLVIPGMRQRKQGTIINIGSMAGKFGGSYGSWYHVSKYAVEGLTDSLGLELQPFGIKVILIEPGAIKTPWWDIAADNMIKTSGHGPYKKAVRSKAAFFRSVNSRRLASRPDKVAHKILVVLQKSKPRVRYAVGGGARSILYLRRLLTDRMFYRIFR